MIIEAYIREKVHSYYWEEDINCATVMLKILSELHDLNLDQRVVNSAIGMHGAGGFGAQCGLVEGSLMFIGIFGKENKLETEKIVDLCYCFAKEFEQKFSSLLCKQLRPQGFKSDNPPHLCEGLTNQAIKFTAEYLENNVKY
ncbi:C_GCAxxG_C_C family putative redox protein [Sporomusaceae bacterium BoRhaA]|uniref:C-GCAxxG-C-C family protein n=1 Tax=Pelorhabdus rhamnosifermentans TaxID=2772457 RepID=UPI001C05EDBD|nr:C-GCAxxG-C-C family protein [Pelorhabdus rhamnosifermentans]MBU2703519.1 C_GCAxxG_C_C family putative redox protein [Pelorhabdus rhamnosifermentans]